MIDDSQCLRGPGAVIHDRRPRPAKFSPGVESYVARWPVFSGCANPVQPQPSVQNTSCVSAAPGAHLREPIVKNDCRLCSTQAPYSRHRSTGGRSGSVFP